jgi:hypothetical protein
VFSRPGRAARLAPLALFSLVVAAAGCVTPADEVPDTTPSEARYDSLKQRTSIVVDFPAAGLVVGSNQIRIRVEPEWGGQPATVQLAGVSGFMPSHSHNSVEGQVSAGSGSYEVGGLDLSMPGHWQFTAHVRRDADDSDDVPFDVLVR